MDSLIIDETLEESNSSLSKIATFMGLTLGFLILFGINVTGNVIADPTSKVVSLVGIGFLIVGLFGGLFWVRSKRK